jgi:hypothetical protein
MTLQVDPRPTLGALAARVLSLWSVQHQSVIETVLEGRFAARYDFVPPSRRSASRWMADQMRMRGLDMGLDDAPVWAFVERPEPRTSPIWGSSQPEAAMRLLRLAVPRERALLSFHYPWAYSFLGQKPERSFLFASAAERAERGYMLPPEDHCLQSWQKMFDLSLLRMPGFTWWNPASASSPPDGASLFRIQATMPFLLPEDVREVVPEW